MEEQTSTEKETTKEQQIAMNNQAEGSNADAEVENRKANEIVNEFNTLGGDGIIINLGLLSVIMMEILMREYLCFTNMV